MSDVWRTTELYFWRLRDEAPEGQEAFVEVTLTNGDRLKPTNVARVRGASWLEFQEGSGEGVDVRVIVVPTASVLRTDILYRSKGEKPCGFSVSESEVATAVEV